MLDFGEDVVAQRLRKIDSADFRAQGSAGWNDL
jgi:hypothetical protein